MREIDGWHPASRTSDCTEGADMARDRRRSPRREPFGYFVRDGKFNIPFMTKASALEYMSIEGIPVSRKTLHPVPMEKFSTMGDRK